MSLMLMAPAGDATRAQRAAMARETREALSRAEMLAAAAEVARDRQAIDLARA